MGLGLSEGGWWLGGVVELGGLLRGTHIVELALSVVLGFVFRVPVL